MSLFAQAPDIPPGGKTIYESIKAFQLTGGIAEVSGLTLKRDRVEMTFTGTFYFAAPIFGKNTGAVFIGRGTLRSEIPQEDFEKENFKRLQNADLMESDFESAVLRFSDDTFDLIGQARKDGNPSADAIKLASEIDARIMKETGANISSRLTLSIVNGEKPGFFFGDFAGGKRGRFSYLFDPQTRIPATNFDINGGEKGLIFNYDIYTRSSEVWVAFYSLQDYQRRIIAYSDENDLVDILHYDMEIDVTSPKSNLGLKTKVDMAARFNSLAAISFSIGEGLGEASGQRFKKQLRIKSINSNMGACSFAQEDWEAGLTVFLPGTLKKGDKIELSFEFEGDFIRQPERLSDAHYPASTTSWYPRHGYLDRATYDFSFKHNKKFKIACIGTRESESPSSLEKDLIITKYKMKHPIALATFALAAFQRHAEIVKWDDGSKSLPLEFSSMSGDYLPIKEDFILAELNNSVRFFDKLFGAYPYENYGAAFHPFAFGQGFPTMIMIPNSDYANKNTYAFISHETAHQWWGNIVAWRSYRDQWLSEGFAEYSGVLYTSLRANPKAALSLVDNMRRSLKSPPITLTGIGKGRLNDVGPVILGRRLNTSKTLGTYQALIYNKGGLVLRMLHFLYSDPSSGDDKAFYAMMKDFVEQYRNGIASSDDFRFVANKHFANTPLAKKYGLKDLNWFFKQWIYETGFPTYRLEHKIEQQPDGSFLLSGNVYQENVPKEWFMPLPLQLSFGGNQNAAGAVAALGPKTPFSIKLPMRPTKVELDPDRWILSEKTDTQ